MPVSLDNSRQLGRGPEKAGVGGSIPSLATMLLKDLPAVRPFRHHPLESKWSPGWIRMLQGRYFADARTAIAFFFSTNVLKIKGLC